ncbi:MAG: PfkB family carbohydrate kinase [Lachnospiraceae bacterium]|jgi:sugar/nucleoside kinase (ribokinase family)|nr:PfkB family carbohydrate kinase [Lachnospiraceae bacterium]
MGKQFDIIIIGHSCLDMIVEPDGTVLENTGGAVTYSSASALSLGYRVAAVNKYAPQDAGRCDVLRVPKEDTYYIPSTVSTAIKNVFLDDTRERRTCTALAQAEAFRLDEIPADIEAPVYQLAALINGDFDLETIKALSKRGRVALDAQGFLRNVENGEMVFRDWAGKQEALPYITYLKTDAAEAQTMTGLSDRYEAAKVMRGWGAKEVMVSHNTEMIVYDGAEFSAWPVVSRNFSGRTGRGDTVFAAYITERQHAGMNDALRLATAAVSLKMEKPYPLDATREEVIAYMEEFLPVAKQAGHGK